VNGSGNGTATPSQSLQGEVYPMVMSVGWNPYYKNTVRSVEIHILHEFPKDFYGHNLNIIILGFIRPEYDYVSLDSLIEDIKTDIQVTRNSLERAPYAKFKEDDFLRTFPEGTVAASTDGKL
jgi:riboflavin kinase